jgi:DNA polymerase III alpha subunit
MSISGDPLDGLKRYIEKKSLGLNKVHEFLETLKEVITDEPLTDSEVNDGNETTVSEEKEVVDTPLEEDNKKNKQDKPVVQVIGYVDNIRKIQTKKGDNMLIVMCSSTGWKFTVVVFPKFYDQIAPLIKSGEIILVK